MPQVNSSTANELLALDFRIEADGPVVATEPVTPKDLVDALGETWWTSHLRKGFPDTPPDEVECSMRPLFHEDDGAPRKCVGFFLEALNPAGESTRCVFARDSMAHVATRGAEQLLASGVLKEGDLYYYNLRAKDETRKVRAPEPEVAAGIKCTAPARRAAPRYAVAPLPPLLERAEPTGDTGKIHYPAFYVRDAREKAERLARKGGDEEPVIETGGVLIGNLYSCPETGAMFSVVWDVLEATDSEGTTFSLSYSSQTWSRIQTVMRARRATCLGQTHGHLFSAGEPCEECAKAEVCPKTTAFLSAADLRWCRAVFHAQPWQLSHIFGLNARGEEVEAFFGQQGGTLLARGYHVIDRHELEPLLARAQ